MLTENERDILLDSLPAGGTTEQELAARSLVGTRRDIRGSATSTANLRQRLGDPEHRARA